MQERLSTHNLVEKKKKINLDSPVKSLESTIASYRKTPHILKSALSKQNPETDLTPLGSQMPLVQMLFLLRTFLFHLQRG